MKWKFKPVNPFTLSDVEGITKKDRIFNILMAIRYMNTNELKRLLNNPLESLRDPRNIKGAELAAKRLLEVYEKKDKTIIVFADYDVDGMTSGYVATQFFRSLGIKTFPYHPERENGYGLSVSFAKRIIEEHMHLNPLIVTVDNGITSTEAVKLLKDNGVETIILDHHEPRETLPECIICDPWLDEKETHLAGVGVTWKVCNLVEQMINEKENNNLDISRLLLPFVAIGTVSDVMPMHPENRAIVKYSLDIINERNCGYVFFEGLKKALGLYKVNVKDIAWNIAPKLNSASRMGNCKLSVQSFYEREIEDVIDVFCDIAVMDKKRKELTDRAFEDAQDGYDYSDDAVVVFDASLYPIGISGIIAGKLSEAYRKPAIVYHISEGNLAHASCRSDGVLDIKTLIQIEAKKGNAVSADGHDVACGAVIYTDKVKELKEGIKRTIEKYISDGSIVQEEPFIEIDTEIETKEINAKTLSQIETIPFQEEEAPTLALMNVEVELLTPFKNKDHLVLKTEDKKGNVAYALGWNMINSYKEIGSPKVVNIAGTLEQAKFSARTLGLKNSDPVLMIKDIQRVS